MIASQNLSRTATSSGRWLENGDETIELDMVMDPKPTHSPHQDFAMPR
jgi:hypothetical protein